MIETRNGEEEETRLKIVSTSIANVLRITHELINGGIIVKTIMCHKAKTHFNRRAKCTGKHVKDFPQKN